MGKEVPYRRLPSVDKGEIMEEKAPYVSFEKLQEELAVGRGDIPRSTKVEIAYSILGSAMALAGEANAVIARSMEGKGGRESDVFHLLSGSKSLMEVVSSILRFEAWNRGEVPF
jgi:hypothetical protein